MGNGRYIHKIIQNNCNAKNKPIMDNYGGSADQLVIMQIMRIVTYNRPAKLGSIFPNGNRLSVLGNWDQFSGGECHHNLC